MTTIRALLPEDVVACQRVQYTTFDDLSVRMGEPRVELTDELVERGLARIGHLQRTDPDGSFVAEVDGEVVGLALALVRDGMWFLSLLVVLPAHHGRGIGKQLLDAALQTATDRSWILSTVEPAALRRYRRAGFAIHPTYTAKGSPQNIPAVQGVRAYDDDRDTLDDVLRKVRGAAMGPEVDYFVERKAPIFVVPGEGFAVLRSSGPVVLGATNEDAARRLLWTALAEATEDVAVDWLGPDQQWAIDVCLDARLSLKYGGSLALRGQPMMSPYLPGGAFG